jgi:hypothetical protein
MKITGQRVSLRSSNFFAVPDGFYLTIWRGSFRWIGLPSSPPDSGGMMTDPHVMTASKAPSSSRYNLALSAA